MSLLDNVNLENFESVHNHHPYVLTSPRSLLSCASLGIQPVELVYRSLEEYEEALCDLPLSQVYSIYEENETTRQRLLLKCRQARAKLVEDKDKSKDKIKVLMAKSEDTNTSRNRHSAPEGRGSRRVQRSRSSDKDKRQRGCIVLHHHQNSDTESTTGEYKVTKNSRPSSSARALLTSSKSVPDLSYAASSSARAGNVRHLLDFSCTTPRSICPCHADSVRSIDPVSLLNDYVKPYEDILSSPNLTLEDRKIMERLILKKGKELEWEKRSQEMRRLIEMDRTRRWTENQALVQSWQDKLSEKRRFENLENTRRYLDLQQRWQEGRSNLSRFLDERDRRVARYLEDMNYKKKKSLLERQRREALRQIEVGKAIEKIVEEDKAQRQVLREKLQRRLEEADVRKRRRERDQLRHVAEMNRLEDVKRGLKLEALEQKSRESVEELRAQIEEKEHRARLNYLSNVRARNRSLLEGAGSRAKSHERVQALHSDLLKGLEEWHKRVYDLHLEAQKRAEFKYSQEINRRRIRLASDRLLREERSSEMLRKVYDLEQQRKAVLKTVIQTKDCKSVRVRTEKERAVQVSRVRAQHAAELRQQLKDRLDPDTFDKKAARAEVESRFTRIRKPGGGNPSSSFSVRFNPRLLVGKRCYSSSCGQGHNHSHNHNGKRGGSANNNNGSCSAKARLSIGGSSGTGSTKSSKKS